MDEASGPPVEMLATLGLRRREAFGAGRCTLVFEAGMHMCHSGGVVQGGFVTGWLDAAMAHAFFSLGQPGLVPMSLEIKVSFFAPARPGLLMAEGWIERQGKSTCFAEAQLKDAAGNVIAKATSTMRLVSQAKVADGSRAAVGG